eukprot:3164095-Lingulodinium_polyedra.AAC.1
MQVLSARKFEADRWISNSVFAVVKQAGISKNRAMVVRWMLIWKHSGSPKADESGETRIYNASAIL